MAFGWKPPTVAGVAQDGQSAMYRAGIAEKPQKNAKGWSAGTFGAQQPAQATEPKTQTGARTSTSAPQGYAVQDGFDMSRAGAAEHAYGDNKGQLETQGAREAYASQPGQYQNAFDQSAAGQYWQSLQGTAAPQADMGAYYDRAYDKGANRINTQFGARGMYGSSAAMNGLGQFTADMGAQEAKDTAEYDQRERAQRHEIMSGAATGADRSGLDRFTAGLDAAGGADRGLLDRLGLLGEGAASADASRNNRVNSTFDNLNGFTQGVSGQIGGIYSDALDTDLGLFDTNQEMGLGSGLQTLNGTQAIGNARQAGTAATAAAVNNDANMAMMAAKYAAMG
jgi:hypothetical protein